MLKLLVATKRENADEESLCRSGVRGGILDHWELSKRTNFERSVRQRVLG
jgi:hypothetical protein